VWLKLDRGRGTVFSISTTGTENVLHSFCQSDGENPGANCLPSMERSTARRRRFGGSSGNSGGTVFSMTTSGGFKVLHSFNGALGDGFSAVGAFARRKGTLYGTTSAGGTDDGSSCGCGTFYRITTAGKRERAL